jgi:predicted ATP-grasp superfamily ATP-dependent carboligase
MCQPDPDGGLWMSGAAAAPDRRGGEGLVLVCDNVDGRSRSAVAAVRALGAAGYRPVVAVSGRRSVAGASRSCAGLVNLPNASSPDYSHAVNRYLAAHPAAAVLAASDAVVVALGQPGADLVDKAVLPKRAAAAGLRVPLTREFDGVHDLQTAADALDYPLVVKAAIKTQATETTRKIDSARGLPAALRGLSGPVVVQPFAAGAMRAVCGVLRDGRLLAAVHQEYVRIWPPDCGTASAAVTTVPDLDLEARLPELLAGHDGVFQVQFVGDQVIDVNPRVYGSLPLAVAAGANLPAIACRAAEGGYHGDVVRGRPGVRYRWLEGDVRRLLHDVRDGALSPRAALRAVVPRRGTAHSIESLRDPGPLLVRLIDVASRRLS